jgi:Domain of unknown function (DUF1707)
MAPADNLRVGDAEREAVAAELREHYAQGRLTLDDLQRRVDAAMAATTRGELDQLVRDLPHTSPPGAPLPAAASGNWRQHGRGHGGGHDGPRRRTALVSISTPLVVVVALAIVLMVTFRFPLPGGLGLLAVLFVFIRSMLRRLFRIRRRF